MNTGFLTDFWQSRGTRWLLQSCSFIYFSAVNRSFFTAKIKKNAAFQSEDRITRTSFIKDVPVHQKSGLDWRNWWISMDSTFHKMISLLRIIWMTLSSQVITIHSLIFTKKHNLCEESPLTSPPSPGEVDLNFVTFKANAVYQMYILSYPSYLVTFLQGGTKY